MNALSPDGEIRASGSGKVVGDAISGAFGVPKLAASAGFALEAKPFSN